MRQGAPLRAIRKTLPLDRGLPDRRFPECDGCSHDAEGGRGEHVREWPDGFAPEDIERSEVITLRIEFLFRA